MRIIFMGNPEFAVPSLEKVSRSKHEILYVVSNPPKRFGRGKKLKETAVAANAKAMGLPVLQPTKLNELEFLKYVSSMQPDIFVVVAYKILPMRLLSIPKFGAINLHPSKLPQYRGAAPIQWSLINGDQETAVTTIKLSQAIDSGSILLQEIMEINDDDNYGTLSARLSKRGAELVVKTLDGIEKGSIKGEQQDDSKVTLAPKISNDDLLISWNKSAVEINNRIRAFSPAPGAFTSLNGKRLKIFSASILDGRIDNDNIGKITITNNHTIAVQTGAGQLALNQVQLEGKKRMDVVLFLRGMKISDATLGY